MALTPTELRPVRRARFPNVLMAVARTGFVMWVASLGLSSDIVRAGDWPQILGPSRNGVAVEEKILSALPAGGPKTVWQRAVGSGFAGVAVADGVALLFHRVEDEDRLEGHDSLTGKILWKASYPTRYAGQIIEDNGPRAVPVVHKGTVFVFGAGGQLHGFELKTGKPLWSRNTLAEFGAPEGYFGAGSTPLVEGDKLLVNVGGRKGAGIVAFDLKTGQTLWQSTDELASYSSPIACTLGDERTVLFITRLNLVGLNPANGKVRFQHPFGQRGPTVNAANPVLIEGHVFLTASYGIGALFARLDADKVTPLWGKDTVLSSQYTTPVFHQGALYGIDGRQDQGAPRLRCVDPKTGDIRWTQEDFGKATLILADDKLLIQKTDGTLVLAEASPQGYKPLGTARIFPGTTRALPALSNGLLYVRDERTLKCVDLRR